MLHKDDEAKLMEGPHHMAWHNSATQCDLLGAVMHETHLHPLKVCSAWRRDLEHRLYPILQIVQGCLHVIRGVEEA